jgi:hypothetical protein
MSIPFGKAHEQWKALKAKEGKQGTPKVDEKFKLDLGPTLDKFDAACKAGDRAKASVLATKVLDNIIPKYSEVGSKLKLASEFKKLLSELRTYVGENLEKCIPTKPPAKYKYMKQGNDGLCAFYALYHLSNGGLDKPGFIKRAATFYKGNVPGMSDSDYQKLAREGNDPAVLTAFGLKKSTVGSKNAYVVADVGKGHFWTVRKVDGVWWLYDGLKGKPEVIGPKDQDLTTHVSGKEVYA